MRKNKKQRQDILRPLLLTFFFFPVTERSSLRFLLDNLYTLVKSAVFADSVW